MSIVMRVIGWAGVAFSLSMLAPPALAAPTTADLFIGTLEKDGNAIVLRRCDLAETRYVLVDAPGARAMSIVRGVTLPAYGEVIASYAELDGRSILSVERIDNLTPGKNCHLLDAINHLSGRPDGGPTRAGSATARPPEAAVRPFGNRTVEPGGEGGAASARARPAPSSRSRIAAKPAAP